jgi:hypothetical protein
MCCTAALPPHSHITPALPPRTGLPTSAAAARNPGTLVAGAINRDKYLASLPPAAAGAGTGTGAGVRGAAAAAHGGHPSDAEGDESSSSDDQEEAFQGHAHQVRGGACLGVPGGSAEAAEGGLWGWHACPVEAAAGSEAVAL